MEINNPQVKEIRDRWKKLFDNPELPLETRLASYSTMESINLIASLYEEGYEAHQEDIDDLFIAWSENHHPILEEDKSALFERMKKRL